MRATVTKHINKHCNENKDDLKEKLARADRLTLTTNCWSYYTFKLDHNYPSHHQCCLEHSPWAFLSDNIGEKPTSAVKMCVASCPQLWKLPKHDPWDSVPCYTHTLWLANNDDLSIYLSTIMEVKAKQVHVCFFNQSMCVGLPKDKLTETDMRSSDADS